MTYYWRVDAVGDTTAKGEVWSFTVEPYLYPITAITATASSAQPDMDAQDIVNGVGLNDADEHSVEANQMWMTTGADKPDWVQFEFDQIYKLDEMWVWNHNQMIESLLGFGAKSVTIEYSADGQTWTTLEGRRSSPRLPVWRPTPPTRRFLSAAPWPSTSSCRSTPTGAASPRRPA